MKMAVLRRIVARLDLESWVYAIRQFDGFACVCIFLQDQGEHSLDIGFSPALAAL